MTQGLDLPSVSRWAARVLTARRALDADARRGPPFSRAEMDQALRGVAMPEGKTALRQLRNRVLLRVMARDLSGEASLEEVCGTMSDLAETSLAAALAWLDAGDIVTVAMGKLG